MSLADRLAARIFRFTWGNLFGARYYIISVRSEPSEMTDRWRGWALLGLHLRGKANPKTEVRGVH